MKVYNVSVLVLIVFYLSRSFSYEGKENVDSFLSTFKDINAPTVDELVLFEEFLKHGDRPYMKPIESCPRRNCKGIKFVGENGEKPIRELFAVNTNLADKKRCIIVFGSYNYPYPEKVRLLVDELKECGYKGHLLMRIGGFPNMQNGGIKLAHVPYSWKVTGLQELRSMGYKEILWLDSAIHPLNNLEPIFKVIRRKGFFLTCSGFSIQYPYSLGEHLPSTLKVLEVTDEELKKIPHLSGGILGMNTTNPKINKFLDDCVKETMKVTPCINLIYPEELMMSVVAYRNNIGPTINLSDITFTKDNYHKDLRYQKCFFLDENRASDPLWDPQIIEN